MSDQYRVLYADPPWRYEHPVSKSREIENHYPTMTLDEIKALPVSDQRFLFTPGHIGELPEVVT